MAATEHRKTHDVKQTEKMSPLITGEMAFGQQICELVFGVNIFDFGLWVQVDSVKQPIKRDSLGSGHVSHSRASALNDHLDHCFIVFENVKHDFEVRKFCVCYNEIHIR